MKTRIAKAVLLLACGSIFVTAHASAQNTNQGRRPMSQSNVQGSWRSSDNMNDNAAGSSMSRDSAYGSQYDNDARAQYGEHAHNRRHKNHGQNTSNLGDLSRNAPDDNLLNHDSSDDMRDAD